MGKAQLQLVKNKAAAWSRHLYNMWLLLFCIINTENMSANFCITSRKACTAKQVSHSWDPFVPCAQQKVVKHSDCELKLRWMRRLKKVWNQQIKTFTKIKEEFQCIHLFFLTLLLWVSSQTWAFRFRQHCALSRIQRGAVNKSSPAFSCHLIPTWNTKNLLLDYQSCNTCQMSLNDLLVLNKQFLGMTQYIYQMIQHKEFLSPTPK